MNFYLGMAFGLYYSVALEFCGCNWVLQIVQVHFIFTQFICTQSKQISSYLTPGDCPTEQEAEWGV